MEGKSIKDMERKIGEIFEYNGEWYKCVKSDGTCNGCVGKFQPYSFCNGFKECVGKIFKELEKVGEPFSDEHFGLVQKYELKMYGYSTKDKRVCFADGYDVFIKIKQNKEDMGENKLNLKPFDIQKAKAGKPVCTRDGRNVRIIAFDAKRKDKKNIIALVPSKNYPGFEDLIAYPNNGNYYGGHENDGDLMMLPEKKEGWVNVYRDCDGANITKDDNIYSSKEAAKASAQVIDRDNYVATTIINWEA